MRKEEEWEEECLQAVEVEKGPGAETVTEETARRRLAERKGRNADYFLQAAWNLIGTDTEAAAVVLGYFAIENRAEEVLALAGYKVHTHLCVIKGVSRVLEAPELATRVNKAYERRKAVNYETDLEGGSVDARDTLEEEFVPLLDALSELAEERK